MPRPGTNGRRITREDLQAAYSRVFGEGEATARAAAPQGIAVVGAVALAVVTVAFLAGRRRGAQPLGRRRDPAAVGPAVDVLLRRLVRAALRRGLAGNWTWLAIAAVHHRPAPGTVDTGTASSRRSASLRVSGVDLGDRPPCDRETVDPNRLEP